MKGKVQDTQYPSRLSKYNMFKRWSQLAESKYIYRVETIPEAVPTNYSEAKLGSTKFQEAKKALYKVTSSINCKILDKSDPFSNLGIFQSRIGQLDQEAHGAGRIRDLIS